MNKFFIRKEADAPGVAQALPNYGGNPGQPAAWEKPIYAIQRQLNKLPSRLQRGLGIYAKPSSKTMFNPKDNPEAYHRDLYNMAKNRYKRMTQAMDEAESKYNLLRAELKKHPWLSIERSPYISRARDMYLRRSDAASRAWSAAHSRIGKPGSIDAMNFIDDIKYGKPSRFDDTWYGKSAKY